MIRIAIFGAGQIGKAVYQIIRDLRSSDESYHGIDLLSVDARPGSDIIMDLDKASTDEVRDLLKDKMATFVINAMPFTFNEKIATGASEANCHYIDFTEDDVMADKVQKIYEGTELTCAVKCGLAPGFINYIGYNLIEKFDKPESLMISVGALPRTVSYDLNHPENSYNLTWSVDGLVNEYIRPCRVRKNGKLTEIPPLGGLSKVILDGIEYEAAHTSGGVGSLARDLVNVPNVCYMTLRYPGHYRYIREVVQETRGNFSQLKNIFLEKFPYTDDDVIVVYTAATGKDANGAFQRRSYSNKFYGTEGLTGIQATTAGSGVAMLELIFSGKISGIVNHSDVNLNEFENTLAFGRYYCSTK